MTSLYTFVIILSFFSSKNNQAYSRKLFILSVIVIETSEELETRNLSIKWSIIHLSLLDNRPNRLTRRTIFIRSWITDQMVWEWGWQKHTFVVEQRREIHSKEKYSWHLQKVSGIWTKQCKNIILKSLVTTFEAIRMFWGSWRSSKNWLKPETKPS